MAPLNCDMIQILKHCLTLIYCKYRIYLFIFRGFIIFKLAFRDLFSAVRTFCYVRLFKNHGSKYLETSFVVFSLNVDRCILFVVFFFLPSGMVLQIYHIWSIEE